MNKETQNQINNLKLILQKKYPQWSFNKIKWVAEGMVFVEGKNV